MMEGYIYMLENQSVRKTTGIAGSAWTPLRILYRSVSLRTLLHLDSDEDIAPFGFRQWIQTIALSEEIETE